MSLGLFNCRLIQPAGDQLFFLSAVLPHRCQFGQALFSLLVTRPARPRPAGGRRMLPVFPSQKAFVLVFGGGEVPSDAEGFTFTPTDSPAKFPEVSRTYGALTEYELWVYSAVFRTQLPRLPSDVKWLSATEMREARTQSDERISKLSQLLDGHPKALEAIEDSIDRLDESNLKSHPKPPCPAVSISGGAPRLSTAVNNQQVSVFISYSHSDERLKNDL